MDVLKCIVKGGGTFTLFHNIAEFDFLKDKLGRIHCERSKGTFVGFTSIKNKTDNE